MTPDGSLARRWRESYQIHCAVRTMISPIVMGMAEDAYAACRESDALIV